MRCQVDKGQIGDSGEYPCSVCKKRVGPILACVWSISQLGLQMM